MKKQQPKKWEGIFAPCRDPEAKAAIRAAAAVAGLSMGDFVIGAAQDRAREILRGAGSVGREFLKHLEKAPA